jgi:hypothetical protein
MKLDTTEEQQLIGRALTRKAGIDKTFIERQVTRIIQGLSELLRQERKESAYFAGESTTPIQISVPPPSVVVQRPDAPPREWTFDVHRDGAGRIKAVVARATG